LGVLWYRRWVVVSILAGFIVVTAIISEVLPKVYSASSTLIVVQKENAATFDAVEAAQVTARTYSDIVAAPVIATQVARQLGGGVSASSVSSSVSVSPVVETQLLKITAEDHDPRQAQILANTYASAVVAYTQKSLGAAVGANVALASSAARPTSPTRPRPKLYVLVAAILGLFFGIGGAFLLDRLDTKLRTAEEVRAKFDEVILARMPLRGRSDASLSAFNEAFGLLRTNLHFANVDGQLDVIAVTSAQEGEGKTTCVSQMAIAMAEVGSKVVVVDADFRRPALEGHVMLHNSKKLLRPGLSNYMVDGASLEDIVHDTGRPNLKVVPTGPLPANPSAFLESNRIEQVFRELAENADLVLIDCPPLAAGADASILAGRVDGVIVVIDLNRSNEPMVRGVLLQLATVRALVLGLVLNRDRSAELTYAYGYSDQ
jgi:succinoglycan biosynthesis transport protein ExoP